MTRFDRWLLIIGLSILFFIGQDRYCDYLWDKKYDWPIWTYKVFEEDKNKPIPFQRYEYYVVIDGRRHDFKIKRNFIVNGKEFYEK